MQALLVERRIEGVVRLAIATSAAAIVLVICALLWPEQVALPRDPGIGWVVVAGGFLLGAGALVNGACYLGSITYISTGNTAFLFTLVGIAAGARFAHQPWGSSMPMEHGLRHAMGNLWLLAVGAFGFLMVLALLKSRESRLVRYATVATGAIAGLLFARRPDWSYGSVLDALAHADRQPIDWMANYSALALFAGAILGALLADRFELKRPTWLRTARCLIGGALMGYGASLVPGGNDTLLLWAIPGLTVYGFVAFGVMAATIAITVWAGQALRRAPRPLPAPQRISD